MEDAKGPPDVAAEVERKNAEMLHQEHLAERSPAAAATDEELEGQDKASADSFPASDPPSPP